jgi:hypothetical protein
LLPGVKPLRDLPASISTNGPITLDEAKRAIDLVKESFGGDNAAAEKALRAIQELTGAAEIGRLRETIEGVRELTHPV